MNMMVVTSMVVVEPSSSTVMMTSSVWHILELLENNRLGLDFGDPEACCQC